jgi:diguanylate cyclase (GGDEF)-like protein
MKFTGRIAAGLIVGLSSLQPIFFSFFMKDRFLGLHLCISLVFIGIGWRLGKRYDDVKREAEKDMLTGIYNRRFITARFPKFKKISDNKRQKLCLLLFDADDFKAINDEYSHATGDRVLLMISQALVNCFGSSGFVARWGGDEFVVLLPNAEQYAMNEIPALLQHELHFKSHEVIVPVSLSFGYAVCPEDGTALSKLIEIAEGNMYRDKRSKIGSAE